MRDPEILELFISHFVPVAVDEHIHRRLSGPEGELFADLVARAGRDVSGKTQGFYAFTAGGRLLAFRHTMQVAEVRLLLRSALAEFDGTPDIPETAKLPSGEPVLVEPPEGGLVVDVVARAPVGDGFLALRLAEARAASASPKPVHSVAHDHLWIRADEVRDLVASGFPRSLVWRLARFHLLDITRGEPPVWRGDEIRKLKLERRGHRVWGSIHARTRAGDRGYRARLMGFVGAVEGSVTRFDLVASGPCWGEGIYTRGAPRGRFPLTIGFSVAGRSGVFDRVPPGCSRPNLKEYLS